MILDPWQQEILNYEGDILLCTGRQVGKTTIFSIKAAEYMVKHEKAKIIIVSLTEDQAKLIIIMILDHLEKNYREMIKKDPKHKPTQNKITLKNGSTAIARPVGNTGDAVRGFTGDVLIIDEASRMPELTFVASKPTLMTTAGKIWMCSTPFGKKGYFYECFQNKENRFKVWHISSVEVMNAREINEHWTQTKKEKSLKFLEEEHRGMSEIAFGQEYLGLFLDELRQFFEDELIRSRMVLKRPDIRNKEGFFVMGCDIARLGGDQSTFEIIEKKKERFYHRENIARSKILTTETEREIIALTQLWGISKIGIDAGAGTLGVSILDHLLEEEETKRKVIAMNNRLITYDRDNQRKQKLQMEDFYDNLKSMLEKGELDLLDDEEVFLSLKSVQFEIANPEDTTAKMRIFGTFTHIAEGLVRAAWLAKKEKPLNFQIYYV